MNIICVYDIASNPQNSTKIKKILRRYLYHIQNSVFQGTLTPNQFSRLKKEIRTIIDSDDDQVIFYCTYRDKDLYEEAVGRPSCVKNII